MQPMTHFRLNRSGVLLALVSAAFASQAQAAAGRAEFIIGGVTIAGRDGVQRPLARGTELDNGDTVRTNDGRAQIRFTDGAYVSLQPNTEYSIRDYRYEAKSDGNVRGIFGLLKGAMRTVTGAIGRINRDRYQIATPTATVGIRGTGGVIQVQDDGSTLVIGTSGIWSLTNPAGSVDVPAGTSALAPTDPNQPPQESTEAPTSGPAPIPEEEPEFVAGEERNEQGEIVIPMPQVLVSGTGFGALLIYGNDVNTVPGMDGTFSGTATFDAQGQLTRMELAASAIYTLSNGTHADFGTDGILAWGRWTGDVALPFCSSGSPCTVNYSADKGLHYVVGMPTTTLPVSGGGMYTLLGATRPTYADGRQPPGTFSGMLNVAFGATPTVTVVDFTIAMPDRTYIMQSGAIPISPSSFFSTGGQRITPLTINNCSSVCSGRVDGFFSGVNAERAGVAYHINDSLIQVTGTAAFKAP